MKSPTTVRGGLFTIALFMIVRLSAHGFWAPPGLELPNVDARAPGADVGAAAEHASAVKALQARVVGARIHFDERLGTPKWIVAEHGFLSGPGGKGLGIDPRTAAAFGTNEAHLATKAFLKEHQALFGHGPEVLATARLKQDSVTAHNGLRTAVWEQELEGVVVFEGLLVSHTTRSGELVNLSSQFIPNPAQAADAGTPNRAALVKKPAIAAADAIRIALTNLGDTAVLPEVNAVEPEAAGPGRRQHFRAAPLSGDAGVELVWLPMSGKSMRLCWHVELTSRARSEMYRLLVDARTGEVLVRHRLTEYLSDASYRVYTSDSPSPFSPGCPNPCPTQPGVVARTLVTWGALNTNASPNGWIDDGINETRGNNVDAHTDRDANDLADLPRPQGAPFRTFDFPLDLTQAPQTYTNAVVVDLFYWNNWMHDRLYELGFTEAARNFQNNNFGRGGLGNDAVQADAQDGSGSNNANFSSPSDGSPGRMQMYLFTGPTPDRDGDLDHEIVLHEYTHGLSNRRVGGGPGLSALQSRGMGEGWSDWYATTLLSEPGDDVNGVYAAGAYATYQLSGMASNYYFGIRRYPYSTDMSKNPLTFKDIDPGQASLHPGVPRSPIVGTTADEVHNQGEVWCMTLWEARARLVTKYGYATGNQLILRLVTDGMNLSPANPNFLQARDAILQADLVDNGGVDLPDLWAAFAKRGMGSGATSPSSSSTIGLVESYTVPDSLAVSPASGFTSSGPVNGPFTPASQNYILLNLGTNPVSWASSPSAAWMNPSQLSGTIASGGSNLVTASLAGAAYALGAGIYTNTVRFTNLATTVVHSRTFVLRVGQPDYFTELFDTGDNDLDNQTLTFTPDGSTNFYSVCREPALVFPTDPSGGASLSLNSHSYLQLNTPANISIYGRSTNVIFLASEGHITLVAPDISGLVTLANHFSRPRVSASLAHLHPLENGGTVSWLQLSNRVTITFNKVVEFGTLNTNTFQIELFYDGRIRMTHLAMGTPTGLVGLSAGNGVPVNFLESNLSGYGSCALPVALTVPHTAAEGDGPLAGQINIFSAAATNVTFALASSAASQATVPATVTLLAGQTGTNFAVTIIDDSALDGTQPVTISATAPGYAEGADTMVVADNETATLSLSVPAAVTEGSNVVSGLVQASAAPVANINVSLGSSDTTELQIPATVVLAAGQTSAVFNVTIVDDGLIDGDQVANLTAHVPNWTDASVPIVIHDNESTNLVLTLVASAREGNGTLLNAGTVRISGILASNLSVSLFSSDTSELTVPPNLTIPAGQTVGTFSATVVDDADIDGPQDVTVTANAAGFGGGSTNIIINDDESPPIPSNPLPAHLASNVIQTTGLAWNSGASPGEIITNEVYLGTSPSLGAAQLQGTTLGTSWSLPGLLPLTTYYWQIVARKTGIVPGPVWQFTTRGPDHFAWDTIASPQSVGESFVVKVTAKDIFETTVSNFTGSVALEGAGGVGGSSFAILGSPAPTMSFNNGAYTAGYSFTPNSSIRVTHVRHYAGAKVSLWTDSGVLVASQNVTSVPGTWLETPLTTPVTLNAGVTYRVGVYTGGTPYYGRNDMTNLFAHGTILQHYEILGDSFPTSPLGGWRWFFVDLRYTTGGGSLAIAPTNSGAFVGGIWTGNLAVLEPATNAVLRADDGNGHTGVSGGFAVQLQNDIAVSVAAFPNPVSIGGNLTYAIDVTNIGPASASGVVVTNLLPPAAVLVSVTPSQGGFTVEGNRVVCSLGSLAGNGSATVTIVASPTAAGTNLNQTTVARAEPDAYLANNTAVVVTLAQSPAIAVTDATLYEGNTGFTNALFTVSVAPPPALPVSVSFATANGSAVAPGDFLATNGVLIFAAGETNKLVSVVINGDALNEFDETFNLNLSSPTNATLVDGSGLGTLLNDDPLPTVSIGDVTLAEGNIGTTNATFAVNLSAPSGLNVSVNYSTVNGNALAGSDYVSKAGSLTFPSGVTSTTIVVAVTGDLQIEADEVFYVDLTSANGAMLLRREGYGLILNDDGLPGQVNRFVWAALGPTQYVGVPFSATLTALDIFNNPATDFNGPANLSAAAAGGQTTNRILGNITNTSISSGTYTLGYSFTPNVDLTVTHVRSFFGNKVSIWTDAGLLLAAQNVSGTVGLWTETPLATPLILSAGVRYRVGVYTGGGSYYWRSDGLNSFTNGVIHASYFFSGDGFPNSSDSALWWLVDLRFIVGAPGSAPIAPSLATPFVNGVWTGNVTALAPATNLVIRADDGNGHSGVSAPLMVIFQNDISLTMTDAPDPVSVGGNLAYNITVNNVGPLAATGVVITNLLPATVVAVSASASQGTVTTNAGSIVFNLGSLAADAVATATVVVMPGSAGPITNVATVYRGEVDALPDNNSASVVTTVQLPAVSINNASISEGDSGLSLVVFNVLLSMPPATNVSVSFATADGSAQAGSDYVATNGVLSFPPGQTNRSIAVQVFGDTNSEPNETFTVTLSNPVNAVLGLAAGLGTIVNDDTGPFYDDFEPTIDSLQWSGFGGTLGLTVLATNYGGSVSGLNSLWFGDGGTRFALSRPIDTTAGGVVSFYLRFGNGVTPWEMVDLPSEGVVLEASTNSGASWTLLGSYTTSVFYNWTLVTQPLPLSVQSVATQLRWRQLLHSGTGTDQWALDNVGATVGPQPPLIVNQPFGLSLAVGATAAFSVTVGGTAPFYYQWRKDATPVAGATNSDYVILGVQTNDAGVYSVIVSNAYGWVTSSNALLTVGSLPTNVLAQGNLRLTLDLFAGGLRSVQFQGNEIYQIGTYISDWGLQTGTNGLTFVRNANGLTPGLPMSWTSGDFRSAAFAGSYTAGGANVAVSRAYALLPGGDVWRTTLTLRNNGLSTISLRCFETFDVDWLSGGLNYYTTANDRYPLNTNGTTLWIGRSIITNGPVAVLVGTPDSSAVIAASSSSFGIVSSANLNNLFLTGGADSEGALADATLDLGRQYTLAPGSNATFVTYQSIATSVSAAEWALVSNVAGAPLRFARPGPGAGGDLRLVLGTADGSPITPDRASRIQVYWSTNVAGSWLLMTNQSLLNGAVLEVGGLNYTNAPARFFRALETP